ncbi:MAG: VWA domain-containing protein [Candidatus Cloacimonetes bacterium]|nr:VWA domain-containing protein [Candidatus Cloacimonadota bacterium]
MYNFQYPLWFLLLLVIPFLVWHDIYFYKKKTPKINFSNIGLLKLIQKRSSFLRFLPIILKSLIIVFLTIALSRPRHTLERHEQTTFGVDIALVIDVSGSMRAVDFRPMNRMEAAKQIAMNFINRRPNDRFSIVTFATYANTLVPLTNDFNVLNTVVSGISIPLTQDATAIGNGLAIGTLRLKDSEAESRVIILLTDGENNAGQIDPITAAEIARSFGIRIYAIGIGSTGPVDFPFQHPVFGTQYRQVNIGFDIEALHRIAEIGGTHRAAMARNTEELQQIFNEIDILERTEIHSNVYFEHKEMFIYYIYIALGLLFILILMRTIFRISLP